MKNLKTTILTALFALCCFTNVNAQSGGRISATTTMGKSLLSIGGGLSSPSSDAKDKAFLSNTTAINADLFFSLKRWTPVLPKPHISLGINVGASYSFGGSGGFGTTPNPYLVTGQTSSMVSDRGTDPIQATFRMGAGPQANFYFGKFIVSPMVLGEYFSMTQKEMSIVQTTQFNGQSYDFNLATLPETKTSGFAVTPKLRLHYMFNDRFGLFADASYTTGPKMETTFSKLIPNGNPQTPGDTYNLQQLQTGTMVKGETKSTAYSAMGFNFGVVIGLGRNGSKGWNGVAETAQSIPTVNTSTMPNNGIVKPACTCCGSNAHDRISCPDITRCNTQTASSQVALSDDLPKAQGDIKKGWDGTVKGLFVGNYAEIVVAKKGGVEKIIEQINKGGKGKATFETYGKDNFIKIVRKEKDIYISEFYAYEDSGSGPMGIINGGYTISCQGTCWGGCKLNLEKTACIPCNDITPCALVRHSGSPWFHDYFDYDSFAIPIETGAGGVLTATSINDIKNMILAQMPHATNIITEFKNEKEVPYLQSKFDVKGKGFVLISKLDLNGKRWFVKNKFLLMCAGTCNGTTDDCKMIIPKSMTPTMPVCNCNTGCRFKVIDFPSGGFSSTEFEEHIINDEQ